MDTRHRHSIATAAPALTGKRAPEGCALDTLCVSFEDAANRFAFLVDEDTYCAKFGLSEGERRAVRNRDIPAMIEAGGQLFYLDLFAEIFAVSALEMAAQPTSMSAEAFRTQGLTAPSRQDRDP
jgi:protocatechuate 4,5-dioxygenase alpha chain